VRSGNVLDVACEPNAITAALRQALSPMFREACRTIKNVYGDGHAGQSIANCLAEISLDSSAILKPFHDLNVQ
jgi:UDP-N-acetylglucosamine 2-epimerase